jgi:predicted GNAT family acetyltransferase
MNEEVINDLYNNAVSKGYKKGREEFVSLLQSNDAVMNDMYSYVQSKGYKKGVDEFRGLIGATVERPVAERPVAEVKKKDTVSPFVDGGSELTKFDPSTGQAVQGQGLPARTEFQYQPGQPLPEQKIDFDSKVKKQKVSAPMSYSNIFSKTIADLPSDLGESWAVASAFIERQLGKAGVPGANPNLTARDLHTYDLASDWRKYTDEVFPTNQEDRSTFLGGVVSGLGQAVPMVMSGGISTVSKSKAAMDIAKTALSTGTKLTPFINMGKDIAKQAVSPSGLIGGSQMSSAMYRQAIDSGATEDQAQQYAIENFFVGTVAESLPVQSMFSRILKKEPTANILRILKEGSVGAVEELTTEMWQTTYENWSAQRIYDFNREMLDGVGEAGAVGGTVGFILNTALAALVGRRAKVKTKEEEIILDKSIDEVESKINTVNKNNENISEVAEELDSIEPIVLNYGDSKYFFAKDKSGRMELAEDPMLEDQAKSMANMLGKVYKGLEFSIEEVISNDPYAPVKYNVIANEKINEQQDAIQEQAAGQVPVQSGTGVSQEVAQGVPQAEPQGVAEEKVKPAISEMAGESVTVRVGNRNVSGIVEVDEGGKATITEGTVTYEIPSDSEFSEFSRPVTISKDGDFVVNGDSFNEARIVVEDGKKKALLIAQDGTTKAVTNPRVVEEIEYNIALASLEAMNDTDADNLINQYEQQRKTEEPAESATDKTVTESDEDRKLLEAFEEIDLIEELALMELEDVESQAKLVEHTPRTMKEAKTYLVKKNPDGTYQATLNGRKVARKDVLDDLGKLFEQRASEDISKLQEQTNKLKQEVEQKLFGKEKAQAEPQVEEAAAPQLPKSPADFALELQDKYGVELDFLGSPESETLSVSRIVVPKGQRGQGVGAKVMEEIVGYADSNNKKLVLTPSKDFGGTSVKRLTDFYKRFGFVENKGKNKDFTIRDTMYRSPEGTIKEETVSEKTKPKPVSKKKNREEIISRPAFTPMTLARQWLLSGGKLRSTQSEENKRRGAGVGKGVREETGMGGVEMRQLVGVIDNKRGLSPEVAAERIYDNLNPELQESIDVMEIRDSIIEVLLSEDRRTWIENQDIETSESVDFDEYDQWSYAQLTDQERADFDEYQRSQDYNDYLQENAKQLAKEHDAYRKSQTYQDYIEEIYGRDSKSQGNAQDQNDGRGQEQGTDGETDSVQEKEVERKLDELLKLDAKDKSTGQKALDYLDGLLKDYDKIEKEGLGINIALPVIKKIVQGIRALVKTGMSLNDAIKRVAKENGVSVRDVVSNINSVDESISRRRKVTVDEMAALKSQIRLEARAAREAKGDLNKKRRALAAKVIAARRKGSITADQARTLVNRISGVNLDNPIMVDRLVAYIDKVFDNASYAADMAELRKLQKQAKRKNHTSMTSLVNEFTSINPEDIPLDRIQDYKEALDFLNTRTPFYGKMNEIFDEVLSYKKAEKFDAVKTKDALMDKYNSIIDNKLKAEEKDNKLKTVEDYVALIKDINSFKRKAYQLLQNEAITQEEYDDFIDGAGETQADIEKKFATQIAKIKNDLIAEIKTQRPKTNPEFSNEENDLIRKYLELSDADLQGLSPEDLFILNDLLYNISNGEIDYYRLNDVVSKAAGKQEGIEVGNQLKGSKLSLGSAKLREDMAKFESSFWEGLLGLGRATSGPLQKFIISPFNRAIGSYEKFSRDGLNEFLKLKKKYKIDDSKLFKSTKQMHKIGMLTTYLQEHMAQFDTKNKGIDNIGKRDWFKEILDSETMRDDYSPEELKIIEEIYKSLPKDKDGNVNPEAVHDSYIANDGKFFTKNEKAFFDEIMEWKKNNSTSKQKAANEMNGNPFKEIPFHMLRSRYGSMSSQITPTTSGDNGMVRIKAGTGKERASEAVGAINTNFEKLFIKGLEQTGRDYFLSKTLKDINNVLASAKKELAGDKDPLVKAISYTLSDALAYEFSNTASQNLLKRLVQARAAMTLFDPIRAGVEFTSTLLSFGLRARTLSGYKNLFGSQGDMKNLLEFTDSPLRLRQNINNAIDINDGRIEPQGMFMKWTNFLSGLPERTMMVTSWMPTFTNEFQNITKEKFDMKKFNDSSAYREKYGKAIKEASAVADAQTEKIIGPTTKAGQRREIAIFPGKTVGRDTVSGQILGFFSNYPYREVTEFVNGFREAGEVLKKGDTVDALSQLQKPLGISLNVAAYGFLSSVVYASRLILLGDDEEEERGEQLLEELMTAKGFIEETSANAAALAASKYAGGGRATLQLLGTLGIMLSDDDETKATIKKMLKGSVYVDPLPTQKLSGFGTADKVNTAIVKYIPQFVVLSNIIIEGMGGLNELKSIYDKVEKNGIDALTDDEELRILALSVVFTGTQLFLNYQGTSLPSYNNLKAGMKAVKEDTGVSDIASGNVPAKKKSSGGGGGRAKTMSKTDLKRYNPELYNELYGEGSATYEIEQEIKAFEKEQRELKKRIKDQMYGGKD